MAKKVKTERDLFLDDVRAEIRNIKKHATKTQIKQLRFRSFNPTSSRNCIYGQMAGDCRNSTAIDLIGKCCKLYAEGWGVSDNGDKNRHFEDLNLTKETPLERRRESFYYGSALEAYIALHSSKEYHQNIFRYLKGKTNRLVIK